MALNPIQVQKYLSGMDYPAKKQDILNKAKQEGADESIMGELEKLPDQDYRSPNDVSQALGKME